MAATSSAPTFDAIAAALARVGGRATALQLAEAIGGPRADALLGIQRAIERRQIVEERDGTLRSVPAEIDGGRA